MEPTESPPDYYFSDKETAYDRFCDLSEPATYQTLFPVLYMLIFILGLFGNGAVIFTVWRTQGKRRVALVYIGNLAFADLTFVSFLPLWVVYTSLGFHWPFGWFLCKISSYVVFFNMYASVFLLTSMTCDRYIAIVHPLSSLQVRTRSCMYASLAAVWTLSGFLALPFLVFQKTWHSKINNHTACALNFRLAGSSEHLQGLWSAGISLSFSVLSFLLPFLVMMVCYGLIVCTLFRHFNIRRKMHQRKRRLFKIIIALVVVFATCLIPFHALGSAIAFSNLDLFPITCAFLRFLQLAYPYATCLVYANSCLNPFLYAFLDLNFRSQCLRLLHLKKSRQIPTKVPRELNQH
ncbi:apelin receptor A-like [Vanacampus margaritifer]